ncbi:beta-ketoacyl synthase N-terminal-like domain-containing protein [Chlorogloeopsis sp. ULAP01]|uniref:type I polyketide synthase n=1 Tax=Chlorogloeopsis sp. ULAP01 TaxID=3056483 RepID=UPI0025AAFB50|nr:type I polyketide synthase [Chlorogloeopsis sp. ULAP01]MDM9383692.1 beta-ketoacyl synthase N-terminal-like domain-containing protein [Chlorogloeopsis sp. ULAP01]
MTALKIDAALANLQQEVNNCEKVLSQLIQTKKKRLEKSMEIKKLNSQLQKSPIAIIGIASLFPQSKNLQEYWEKILHKVDCITDVPSSRWDVESYYDPDPKVPDKTYCKRGGFLPEIDFNPMEFGLPPNILEVTDISQLLSLVVAKQALEDAGYGSSRQFNRERTGVILGVALARQLSVPLCNRLQYPIWEKVLKSSGLSDKDTQKIVEKMKLAYVNWEENAFPGMLANVVSGRIANRLDLGGMNCVVDAACASSFGALKMAVSELNERRSDMMLTGGVDTDNSILAYMCFSKTPAVSPSQNTKPFDDDADGMMLGEGIGMIVLKRLEDAERDDDRIYAVIKGIGTSSDGKYKSIYAPRPEGQVRALCHAYEDAGFSPLTVSLVEAHGTGTRAGDVTEFTALKEFFSENNSNTQHIALGSVKSQIGHTKAAAGTASLIKTALALHHKVLPPTINITKPNSKFNIETSPFYLNTETKPWLCSDGGARRAGVSCFGFGGTNYHVVMEEYESEHHFGYRLHSTPQSILLSASTTKQLLIQCEDILQKLQSSAKDKCYLELIESSKSLEIPLTDVRVGFVVDSLAEACDSLQIIIDWLKKCQESESWNLPQGIYYRKTGIALNGKVVALFSGQGSQYLNMGRELAINFPCLRQAYSYMNGFLHQDGLPLISDIVFPPPGFDAATRQVQSEVLQRTEYAQPAIGVFSVGLYKILQQAGFKPDFVAGHSFGELTALWAAEVLSDEDYFFLVKARSQAMAMPKNLNFDAGAMLSVKGDVSGVNQVVKNFPQVTIANLNSKNQVVLAGVKPEIAQVQQILNQQGYSTVLLSVSAAFHTPLVSRAQKPFAQAIEAVTFKNAKIPVYSNVTGKRYPTEPQAIKNILKEHLINPVRFQHEIENIYADGGCIFIEFGPRNILTNLVKDTLGDKPHLAVALNATSQKDSDRLFREAVMQLRVAGLPLKNLDPYQRSPKVVESEDNKILNVRLNGTNYVAEKTKIAFENALKDGQKVKVHTSNSEVKSVTDSIVLTPPACQSNGHLQKNGHQLKSPRTPSEMKIAPISTLSTSNTSISVQQAFEPKMQKTPNLNYQSLFASLESSLKQFHQHQDEILRIHEQFLNHQIEYGKTFCQLMEQQNLLFVNENATQQQLETKLAVLESSERSINKFQAYQDETLRIHEEYLKHEKDYTKTFCQLIQQQYEILINSDSKVSDVGNRDSPAIISTVKENDPIKQDSTVPPADPSVAIPTNGHSSSPEPFLSNGSNHSSDQVWENMVAVAARHKSDFLKDIQLESTVAIAPPTQVSIDVAEFSQSLLNIVSEKTGYPAQILELEMDMEADLGIDSIKRVEILGTLQQRYPNLPQANPDELTQLRTLAQIVDYIKTLVQESDRTSTIATDFEQSQVISSPTHDLSSEYIRIPASGYVCVNPNNQSLYERDLNISYPTTSNALEVVQEEADEQTQLSAAIAPPTQVSIDVTKFSQSLLNIVSEKTGYPAQILELEMDMEADLGIDSIKRVEILGALQQRYPNLPQANPDELTQLCTLAQIVEYLQLSLVGSAEKKNAESIALQQQPSLAHNIPRCAVKLKFLPKPDFLDFTFSKNYIALLTDDGGLTTAKLAQFLKEQGWKVIVLSFPPSAIAKQSPLPEEVIRIALEDMSEEHLKQQLTAIANTYGSIGAFIHLNPLFVSSQNDGIQYLEVEKAIVKHIFLIAKHLKKSLHQAAHEGYSCFCTITRLDGAFGLTQKVNFGAISAGLFGLTKSLNFEWESVFCRAIDLYPNLDAEESAQDIIAELHDPNRLIAEVGYSKNGRVTLTAEPFI